jgi:hypothetical protein
LKSKTIALNIYSQTVHLAFSSTAKVFNFTNVISTFDDIYLVHDFNMTHPLKTPGSELGIFAAFNGRMTDGKHFFDFTHPSEIKEGFSLTFHDPFEVISKSSTNFYTLTNEIVAFWVVPSLINYDDSIVKFNPDE